MPDPHPYALIRALATAALLLGLPPGLAAQTPDADPAPHEPTPAVSVSLPTEGENPGQDTEPGPSHRLEDADDALFDGDHARALEIYLQLAEGSGLTAGEAAQGAAQLYATGRGTAKDPELAAEYFGRAFDLTFEAALEVQAMGEAGLSEMARLDAMLMSLADRFATGHQVQRDFQRAVDMDLRIIDELLSGAAVMQLAVHYSKATPLEARYVNGREFLVSYVASLALALMAGEVEEELRENMLNNVGELRRGGADRADDNLLEAKSQPFPVSYEEAFWAYELAAERHASGTAMYSLGVMHYRSMGMPEYWIDGADSPATRFRKERLRLETAREWFHKAIVNGDPEGETWFVGVSDRLLDLAESAADNPALAQDVQEVLERVHAEPDFGPETVAPATWAGVEAFRQRAGAALPSPR